MNAIVGLQCLSSASLSDGHSDQSLNLFGVSVPICQTRNENELAVPQTGALAATTAQAQFEFVCARAAAAATPPACITTRNARPKAARLSKTIQSRVRF